MSAGRRTGDETGFAPGHLAGVAFRDMRGPVARHARVRVEVLVRAMLLLSLWLMTRPYPGIVHDARLYLAQAMRKWTPAYLADDLYFRFGSQDAFTLFSHGYAPLVAALGPSPAHMVATGVSHMLWMIALLRFTRGLTADARDGWRAACAVVLLNPAYGPMRIFTYGEAFFTPRILAEAAVMFAMAALLEQRKNRAFGILAASVAVHPLMTAPAGIIATLVPLPRIRQLALLAVVAVTGVVAAAALHLEPFVRLWQTFDPEWFAVVAGRLPFALVTRWEAQSFSSLILPVSCLVLFRDRAGPTARSLVDAVLMVSAGSLVCSVIGADLLRNVFVLNLQLWRALWLVMLVGNAVAVPVLVAMPPSTASRRFLGLALVLTVIESWSRFASVSSGVVALMAVAMHVDHERRAGAPLPRAVIRIGAMLAGLAIAIDLAAGWIFLTEVTGEPLSRVERLGVLAIIGGLFVGVIRARVPRLGQGMLAVLALSIAVFQVDQRSAWKRFVEDDRSSDELRVFLAPYQNVYWESGLQLLWLKMRKSSYYSCTQGSGLMLFRAIAMDYQRRGMALSRLASDDFESELCGFGAAPRSVAASAPPDRSIVAATCRRLPDLDALVLTAPIAGVSTASWHAPAPVLSRVHGHPVERRDFFLIPCAGLREAAR